MSLWFLVTHLMAASVCRRASAAWPWLQKESDALAANVGISARVALLVSERDAGPFTVGVFRPRIVLPSGAATWDGARLRSVLLHELAHIRRADCRTQVLVQAACAIYWFHPLVWIAARALRRERERACDDDVLMHGAQPSMYATHLVETARGRQPRLASPALLAMARPRELEGRVLAILAAGRARVPAPATRWAVAALVGVTTIATLGAQLPAAQAEPFRRVGASAPPSPAALGRDPEKATLALALDTSPDVIPALIAALEDPDSQVREKAALGLGWRKDARVVAPLIAALRDRDSQVREKAAIALGASGDVRARAPLEAALNDPNDQVREKATAGLLLLGSGRDLAADGALVRAALNSVVGGLLRRAEQ